MSTIINIILGWHHTLSGDLKNYYFPVASHVLTPDTLIYPPGANLFFGLFPTNSLEIYEIFFIGANIFFLFILFKITKNFWALFLLILAAGPLILFRFDLLVMVLLILSIKFFQKENFFRAGIFLGAATITKFFPLVLLPYFLFILWSRKKIFPFLIAFLTTIFTILAVYLNITQLNFSTITSGLYFNFSKSVHMESVLGSALTIVTFFINPGSHGVQFINALWVLDPLYLLGHARIFRIFPIVGLAATYLIIILRRNTKNFNVFVCFFIILVLIITSQVFSPQYIVWVAFLFPLLPFNKINFFLILLSLICTQIIYPINYGELIDFYNFGKNQWIFVVLTIRNAALIILTARIFYYEIVQLLSNKSRSSFVQS